MKILLCTDGSVHSSKMVKKFAEGFFAPGTEVRIVSVYEKSSYMLNTAPMGALAEYYAIIDNHALKLAETAIADATAIIHKAHPDLIISSIVLEGSAKKNILKEAETSGSDLIVVGSHGHGIVGGFLLGSVSLAVVLHAKCSVEIVRSN
jgi:nucleotide-binding universal stress UspA family protein